MSKKEKFIEYVQKKLDECDVDELSAIDQDVLDYFEQFKTEKPKSKFTENGLKILTWMRENETVYNGIFKAKDIGEGLFIPPRSAAGSLRKLVTDGYVSKTKGDTITTYNLTESGRTVELTN